VRERPRIRSKIYQELPARAPVDLFHPVAEETFAGVGNVFGNMTNGILCPDALDAGPQVTRESDPVSALSYPGSSPKALRYDGERTT
jgi:hypothetical protein